MTRTDMLFFASGIVETIRSWSTSKSGSFQSLVFWGSFVVIALIVFGWAVIFRKESRLPRHHHRHHPRPAMNQINEDDNGGGFFSRFGRKHRKRKNRRHANPTLAETGGLPEVRDRKKQPPA